MWHSMVGWDIKVVFTEGALRYQWWGKWRHSQLARVPIISGENMVSFRFWIPNIKTLHILITHGGWPGVLVNILQMKVITYTIHDHWGKSMPLSKPIFLCPTFVRFGFPELVLWYGIYVVLAHAPSLHYTWSYYVFFLEPDDDNQHMKQWLLSSLIFISTKLFHAGLCMVGMSGDPALNKSICIIYLI